jgi:hypothetical protein
MRNAYKPATLQDTLLDGIPDMLYDGRGDYIRRHDPDRVPSSGVGMAAWLAAVLILGAAFLASIAPRQAHEPDRSFQQLFMWG